MSKTILCIILTQKINIRAIKQINTITILVTYLRIIDVTVMRWPNQHAQITHKLLFYNSYLFIVYAPHHTMKFFRCCNQTCIAAYQFYSINLSLFVFISILKFYYHWKKKKSFWIWLWWQYSTFFSVYYNCTILV